MGNDKLIFADCAEEIRKTIRPEDASGTKYIGLEHIEQGSLHLNGYGVAEDVSSAKAIFSKGDILFGKLRPYFRKVVRAPFDGVCSTDIWVVRARDGINQGFLYYWMASFDFVNFSMQGSEGTKMPRAKWEHVGRHEIPFFDETEQRTIAHILGSLDDKIELNRRMNETLEAMAQAMFKSWFIDFDPVIDNALAAGHPIPEELQARAALRESLGDARKPLPDDICNLFPNEFEFTEEMGWIPKGWEARSVSDLLSINPTVKIKKGSIAPYADMASLPTEGFTVGEIIKKPHNGGAKFQNGDVLLARITPCLENGKTAVVDFLDGDQVGFGSTEFIVLRGKAEVQTSFVACLARNPSFRQHCIASMVGSSGRQRVQNACFDNYYITRPRETKILIAFNGLTEPAFRKITHNSQLNRDLSKTRETLIPKFLSGELRLQLEEMEVAI